MAFFCPVSNLRESTQYSSRLPLHFALTAGCDAIVSSGWRGLLPNVLSSPPLFRKMQSENSYAFVLGSGTSLIPLLAATLADSVVRQVTSVTAFKRINSETTSSLVLGVSKLPSTSVARVETGSYVCSNSDTFFGIGDETEHVRESDEHPVFAEHGG